jgi:hypothetical protein
MRPRGVACKNVFFTKPQSAHERRVGLNLFSTRARRHTPTTFRMLAAWVVLAVEVTASIPRPAQYFDQLVNHFDSSSATYRQRFYSYDGYFGGPSSPIICIIGVFFFVGSKKIINFS